MNLIAFLLMHSLGKIKGKRGEGRGDEKRRGEDRRDQIRGDLLWLSQQTRSHGHPPLINTLNCTF